MASAFLVLLATPVYAWQATFQITFEVASETSIRGSTETSSAGQHDEAQQQQTDAAQGAECANDSECKGWCREGRCVDHLDLPPVPAPVESGPPVVPPAQACTGDAQCQPGQRCVTGQCATMPPPPPSSSLWRRGSELYLRSRAVQLRQDLALGEGPVIAALAAVQDVPALVLGRTLRAHRAELVALMGDGADPAWATRFLDKVEALGRGDGWCRR